MRIRSSLVALSLSLAVPAVAVADSAPRPFLAFRAAADGAAGAPDVVDPAPAVSPLMRTVEAGRHRATRDRWLAVGFTAVATALFVGASAAPGEKEDHTGAGWTALRLSIVGTGIAALYFAVSGWLRNPEPENIYGRATREAAIR